MKRILCLFLALTLSVLLCACAPAQPTWQTLPPDPSSAQSTQNSQLQPTDSIATEVTTAATEPTVATTEPTIETTEPTAATTEPATQPTKPEHSQLYIPGYSTEQIAQYFVEVILDSEYTSGDGDAALVQKWTVPIRYRVHGTPTQEDYIALNKIAAQLNEIPGFPGIYPAAEGIEDNLTISFLDRDGFNQQFSHIVNGEESYGAVEFWYYNDTNEIYTAQIGCRTDIEQSERSSVIPEEIVNGLGMTDTVQREDSVVYQYSNSNLELSEIDLLLLKLLYHPMMRCGMDYSQCLEVLEELYY